MTDFNPGSFLLDAYATERLKTVSQPVYRGGCWVVAGSLKVGDAIGGPGGAEISITHIEPWNKPTPVYQLSLEGAPVFVAEGILVHNAKIH